MLVNEITNEDLTIGHVRTPDQTVTNEEIEDMEKLLMLLDPMERLFTRLGSQSLSTIHLVVPTLLVSVMVYSLSVNLTLTLSHSGSFE